MDRRGLSLTERRILRAIAAGASEHVTVLRSVWATEQRPFAGDTVVFMVLARLVAAGLVEREGLRLTDRGTAVLAAAEDASVTDLDRWVGGVHLTSQPAWRWDPRAETLVAAQ